MKMELKNDTSWNLKRVQRYRAWDLKKDYSRFNLPRIYKNRAAIGVANSDLPHTQRYCSKIYLKKPAPQLLQKRQQNSKT